MSEEFLLEMNNIHKSFPGVKALDGVKLRIKEGEAHSLMGENGAGKSTLMKVLTGIYDRDENSGDIIFDGQTINPQTPIEAQKLGISTVYQELNLVPDASIAENIFLGREPRKNGFIDWKKMEKDAEEILTDMGIKANVKKSLNTQSMAIQQMVSIARAISINAKLLVLDEPTSSLDENEAEVLFKVIRSLKSKGVAIIYISHKLKETFAVCERATILRDGKFVDEYIVEETSEIKLVSDMIGKDASSIIDYEKSHDNDKLSNPVICEVADIHNQTHNADLNGANLKAREGEVLGLAGLLGSGRTELAEVMFGIDTPNEGTIKIKGGKIDLTEPSDAINNSFAFVPEDRREAGIIPEMSVRENITLALLPKLNKMGVVTRKKEDELVEKFIDRLNIKTPSPEQAVKNLSGGNQQKVILARWLCMYPEFIILDEPTRGIDVGAKSEIEDLIHELANDGISILMISSELPELIRNCDRVSVMADGNTVKELVAQEISEDNIMQAIAEGHQEIV